MEIQQVLHSVLCYKTICYEILCSKFTGPFGFYKPWTAVRDASGGETYSQQFLTPSIVEGIRQKLEVKSILRHRLIYAGIDVQQEVVQAKAWSKKGKQYIKERSILKRGSNALP